METVKMNYMEISIAEASAIYGGEPTTETSLAYDLGWLIGCLIFMNQYKQFGMYY